ncbi:MAG: hypothetical protein HY314_09020 [Acidobacteria bacterium]|nr:hypothetical protein [Acidobacteriota bacterium]
MSKERNELKAVLRDMAEKHLPDIGAHATAEELVSYHSSALSAEEKNRLQDHLVWCRECVGLLVDLAAFGKLDQEHGYRPSDAQVGAAWKAVRRRIREEERGSAALSDWRQRLGRLLVPPSVPHLVAASLLMVSLALGAWNLWLREKNQDLMARLNERLAAPEPTDLAAGRQLQQVRHQLEETTRRAEQYQTQMAELRQSLDEVSKPQLNMLIEDLYPREPNRGSSQEGALQTIKVPSRANLFALILNLRDEPSYPDFSLEIVDQRGKTVWRARGLQKSPDENFTVALQRRLLPAGLYRIKLYGLRPGQWHLVEEYALRIQY